MAEELQPKEVVPTQRVNPGFCMDLAQHGFNGAMYNIREYRRPDTEYVGKV